MELAFIVKIIIALVMLVLAACGSVQVQVSNDPELAATIISAVLPTATDTTQPAATLAFDTATPAGTFDLDGTLPPAVDCTVLWDELFGRTFHFEPDESSTVFATLGTSGEAHAEAMTADGWIGFEPGVAQAGNFGFRRLRWLKQDETVTLEGAGCADLPVYSQE